MVGEGRKISPTVRRRRAHDKSSRYVHTELGRRTTAASACRTGCNAALLLARSRTKLINGEIGVRSTLNERCMYIRNDACAFFLFLLLLFLLFLFFLFFFSSRFCSPSVSLCLSLFFVYYRTQNNKNTTASTENSDVCVYVCTRIGKAGAR